MKRLWASGSFLCLWLLAVQLCAEPAMAPHCMIATVNPLATDVAVQVLRDGGNAVDAAVGAALILGVVDSHNSGLGGGCLILVRRADGTFVAIDGREMAPAAATRDMYVVDGTPQPDWSKHGPLASGVPGALAAYEKVLADCGRKSLSELLLPAAEIGERGFPVSRRMANALRKTAPRLRQYAGSRAALLDSNGEPYEQGEMLRQPDLAATYRAIATGGTDWFYRGPFAQQVAQWMADNGGIITVDDFATYRPQRREPIRSRYRGRTIVGFPPPSSGGVHVAQVLNILENFDLSASYTQDPSRAMHLLAESMKLAFADRAHWLGDADFVDVPRGLVDTGYAKELAARIDPERASRVASHGHPPAWQSDHLGGHTTHIAAADAEGYWVAITATINTAFGSKVIVPGTGVVLNNEMDDFSMQPGVPNAFGLVGAENNAIEPGKRPLSSMSPTIVLDEKGQPVLTLGAAGGPRIITQVILTIVNQVDFGMPLAEAVSAPRIHHQWLPNQVSLERLCPGSLADEFARRGHQVGILKSAGRLQAIGRIDQGQFIGVADPRIDGKAAGF